MISETPVFAFFYLGQFHCSQSVRLNTQLCCVPRFHTLQGTTSAYPELPAFRSLPAGCLHLDIHRHLNEPGPSWAAWCPSQCAPYKPPVRSAPQLRPGLPCRSLSPSPSVTSHRCAHTELSGPQIPPPCTLSSNQSPTCAVGLHLPAGSPQAVVLRKKDKQERWTVGAQRLHCRGLAEPPFREAALRLPPQRRV